MHEPGSWIRPLNASETLAVRCSKVECCNTVQSAWLTSVQPINTQHVYNALNLLAVNSEVMQTCIGSGYFNYWFRRMDKFAMDFKIVEDDPMTVSYDLKYTPFVMEEGPLWRARLSMLPQTPEGLYQAALVISFQHVVTDGTSTLLILRDAIKLINAAARGENMSVPFRPLCMNPDNLATVPGSSLLADLVHEAIGFLAHVKNAMSSANPYRIFNGTPGLKEGRVVTRYQEFTEETTRALVQRCKTAQVSVNCCIATIARFALLKLLQDYNPNCTSAPMATEGCVNLRRYFPAEEKELLGLFIGLERQNFVVHESDALTYDSFWGLAKTVQKNQDICLNEGRPATRTFLFRFSHLMVYLNKWLTERGSRNFLICHMSTNSMGDLDRLYFNHVNATHVRVSKYVRSLSSEYSPVLCDFRYHTLNNKLLISLDQYTNILNDDMATTLLHYVANFVSAVAETGTVCWKKL